MSRIHVALVLPTATGGIGRHVRSLAGGLVDAGHQVAVLGPQTAEEQFAFAEGGATFAPVEIPGTFRPIHDARALSAVRALTRHADVLHAHGLRAGMLARLARSGRSTPLVVTWHNLVEGDGPRGVLLRRLERAVAAGTDVTLCASSDLRARVEDLGGRDVRLAPVAAPERVAATRDAAAVRDELGAGDRPLILSVGRLWEQKGYDLLIDAAARWRDLDPLVVIVGDGPDRPALQGRADASGAPVRFLGHRDDVADLLAACDLAVVSSRWEARQLFAQEAMVAGRPLVATAVGGIPELVGEGAVLVAGDTDESIVKGLENAVRELLTDPDEREAWAERARARARTWPTERDTVAQVVSVYEELLRR